MRRRARPALYLMLAAGLAFVAAGLFRGEMEIVWTKAIRLCLECIGIG